MDFFIAHLFSNPFLLMALGAGLAASVSGGIIGTYVVTKRIVFISGSISHAVLGGMGLFLWLKRTYQLDFLSPIQGALVFALLSAALLGWVHLKYKEREDSIIAALWATGTSIGVIFITFTPGYNVELMNFLFGNILWATQGDLIALLILDALVIASTRLFYKKFQAICFDEKQAALQGLRVKPLYIFLLCLIALSVVVLIQVVGAILVIALLTIPTAATAGFTKRLSTLMKTSIGASMLFTCIGMYAAYELNWPPGATITLIAALFYSLSLGCSRFIRLK
jgi:zinc transport system permease protein